MNVRSALLALFVVLTMILASTTAYELSSKTTSSVSYSAQSASSPSNSTVSHTSGVVNETIFIHVVNSTSGSSMPDEPLTAGPASSPTDVVYTPGGPTISECVHVVPSGASVGANDTVIFNGTTTTFTPCHLVNYDTNGTGWIGIANQNASYFFVEVGTMVSSNSQIVTIEGSPMYVTAPFPEGNFTVSYKLSV